MTMNRRVFIIKAVVGTAALAVGRLSYAQDTMLSETDKDAIEFNYLLDTTKVDNKKFPAHTVTQKCSFCQLYEDSGNGTGGCGLFPGKKVVENGWCSSFG